MPPTRWLGWLAIGGAALALAGCDKGAVPAGPMTLRSRVSAHQARTRSRTYWPTQGWKTKAPAAVGMNEEKLKEAMAYAFARTGDDKDRKGIRTNGVVIIRRGYLVWEQYARGYHATRSHLTWSVSKSFVNAMFGIAVRKGLVSLDDKAHKYVEALRSNEAKAITLRQLLNMVSGLCWNEGYEASPLKSSVIKMLFTAGRDDMAAFAAKQGVCYLPGTHWYYSSGTSNLLMGILRTVTGKAYPTFPWKELFDPIGMKDVTWERDASGAFVGSSFVHAPLRQMAKFGYLYLNDGVWDGTRLLPKGWVKFSTTAPAADPKGIYGAHWWLNVGRPQQKILRRFPDAPADLFFASGHWGQYIFVLPSHDMVVVRTGDDRDKSFDRNTFLQKILASLTPQASAPPSPQPREPKRMQP